MTAQRDPSPAEERTLERLLFRAKRIRIYLFANLAYVERVIAAIELRQARNTKKLQESFNDYRTRYPN